MVEIDEEIKDSWKCPPEGYNEDLVDDEDFEYTRFGMNAIDRIVASLGKSCFPILNRVI